MPHIEESIPSQLAGEAEAARAWFSRDQGTEFNVTGIVDPDEVRDPDPGRELQLILCGVQDGQDVCLRERFEVTPAGAGFEVSRLEAAAPAVGSPAPLLDPPEGVRAQWLGQVLPRHAFSVLVFYRGFW